MKHFALEDWIDFVNQTANKSRKLEMERHLGEDGCEQCAKVVSRWQRIRRAAAAELSYQPSIDAVRIAKAAFSGSEWARKSSAARKAAVLLFDSFLQPVLEGVRSSSGGARRMLYRADPFQIDLQIESQLGGRRISVTGQLLDLRHPDVGGCDVPVTVSNLRGSVVRAMTNKFGEFHEEIENSGDLELEFCTVEDKPTKILLQDVLGKAST